LKLFENEYHPVRSLFTDEDCDQFRSDKTYAMLSGNDGIQEPNIIDLFEDSMLEEVEQAGIVELKDPAEFALDQMKRKKEPAETEDLGIIDLDQQESDDFDELDDDKLPVLKNTYSKKNRPNNSKSVAIGSRSQGGSIKHRTIT
jgi:hypothetical protein